MYETMCGTGPECDVCLGTDGPRPELTWRPLYRESFLSSLDPPSFPLLSALENTTTF